MNEDILVDKLRKGEHGAFETIFKEYFHKLYIFSCEYVKSTDVAKDLTQETFSKLWEIRESLSTPTNLSSVLFTIIRNKSLNYLKRALFHQKFLNEKSTSLQELQLNYEALKDSSSEKLFLDDLEIKINKTIASLTPKTKEVFLLSRQDNLKYKEIAEKLNISVKTVETHISEALKVLRKGLKDFF